jgi:hypothetical protein
LIAEGKENPTGAAAVVGVSCQDAAASAESTEGIMSWFPNRLAEPEPELSAAAFLAAGKALHIANNFEAICKHVLRVAEMASYLEDNADASLSDAFAVPKERLLDGTIKRLGQFPDITEEHLCILQRTKDARNFIAHEGALFSSGGRWLIVARLKALRQEVAHLAHGANLVSLWSYEIENKGPGPIFFFHEYPKLVDDWVFGHVRDTIELLGDHPEVLRDEEELRQWTNRAKRV